MNPLVSVIVPVYNSSQYLTNCIESILSQTYKYFELILINDGSTDESASICERYAKMDDRIRYYYQNNQGQAAARNRGISCAKGEWILFADSDDAIHPEMISILLTNALNNSVIYSEGAFAEVDMIPDSFPNAHRSKPVKYLVNEANMMDEVFNCWVIWGKLIHRKIIERNTFPENRVFEDNAVILKWLLAAGEIVRTNEILYYYRINLYGTTKSSFSKKKLDYLWALEERLRICKQVEFYRLLGKTVLIYLSASIRMCKCITRVLQDSKLEKTVKRTTIKVTMGYLKVIPHRFRVLIRLGKLIIFC